MFSKSFLFPFGSLSRSVTSLSVGVVSRPCISRRDSSLVGSGLRALSALLVLVFLASGCASEDKRHPGSGYLRAPEAGRVIIPTSGPSEVRAGGGIVGVTDGGTRFEEDLGSYLIGPRDLLEIKVFEVEELSAKARVNRRGFITLPLIGPVKVSGRNITEVENIIAEHLAADYLQDPHVAVFIEDYASQKLTVQGYVKSPGVFDMEGRTTLLQAIAMAGGVTEIADTAEIFVFRNPYGQNRTILEFNLDEIQDGEMDDPLLRGTDIIVVDSSTTRRLLKDVTGTLRGFMTFGTLPIL